MDPDPCRSCPLCVHLIPAVYWLTRELFGPGPAPWVAAALVACSPLQLLYAQEARQYALWMLLLTLSCLTLAIALRRGTWGNLAGAWSDHDARPL
ncbi:glycosyltransferase family 39 protein [Allochromatium tepidum]|uniref:Glycosyltransferase RgtA/B/C/D-like domain-containing protein n=1 Tax=Allochromatium tepidum TaxID=553982 RepID=A0ABM7QQ50_9GAMM|nr:glycosyltransferase family 39 protein [Allochromatium tepidum]BCU08132.1 hypothetical protein Atep_28090 [Allochromatium tepidum]